LTTAVKVGVVALLMGSVGLVMPVSAAPSKPAPALPEKLRDRLSEGALASWYRRHPEQAPPFLRLLTERFTGRAEPKSLAPSATGGFPMSGSLFNRDGLGLPQNEESVARCGSGGQVLEGTNDYRGVLNAAGNFTGWHLSTNGGASLAQEGLLPTAAFQDGTEVPSGGDPVSAFDSACNAYMADLNFTFIQTGDTFTQYSGIGLYKSTAGTLRSCPGGDDPTCWPTRAVPVQDISSDPSVNHFFDKPWLYVGTSAGQTVLWLTYTDFAVNGDLFTATIKAVRCDANLVCGTPVAISDGTTDVQFSDVTVGPDGRAYVSWIQINTDPVGNETFGIKLRVAEAGSTAFGPERVVTTELKPIPFGGFLHADGFRVATYPKSDVKIVNGKPRVYVVWESCQTRPVGISCEYPRIQMAFSDSLGAGWSAPTTLSTGGDNYFVTLSANPGGANLAVAYWTSRFDPLFNSRQDLELLTVGPAGSVLKRQRLTDPSNDTQADTYLGGFFIGDYIEVTAQNGQALIGINANYRKERFGLDPGQPVAQQDNYLLRATL
jgi:hypothetical protein